MATTNRQLSLFILYTILSSFKARVLNEIGRLYIPHTDIPGAENAAIDYLNDRIFVADGYDKSVNSMDFELDSNCTTAEIEQSQNIYFEPAFLALLNKSIDIADVTCVAMSSKGYVLSTIVPRNHSLNSGWLAFIDPAKQSVFHLLELRDCFLPDHVTSTSDGNVILVACEGEPSENEEEFPTVNPPGSVGYINVASEDVSQWQYTNIGFTQFDRGGSKHHLLPSDIYYPIEVDTHRFSLSAEPEHIVVDFEDSYAYICIQESNAVAVMSILDKEIINVFSFGFQYFGDNGGLDASDKDGMINIAEYDNVYAMRQPDDIDYWRDDESGRQFLFTANEGDSKGFDESRVKKLDLSEYAFGNETDYLQSDAVLGRLKVSNLIGVDMNETFNALYTFSSRDFTVYEIWTDANGVPMNMSLHYSSNNEFEARTAELIPDGFNCDYSGGTFDERSDAKGPEPEGIAIGECENGRKYVFICLERVGGIFAYDFTDLNNISFSDYYNNRNFSLAFAEDMRPPIEAGDIGPEQMRFIPAHIYGEPLLVVSHPQSASVTMYRIDCEEIRPEMRTSTTMSPSEMSTSTYTMSTTQSNASNDSDGTAEEESKLTTQLLIIIYGLGAFGLIIFIICVYYIFAKMTKRTIDPYNGSWCNAMKQFRVKEYVSIVLELFDIVTDYIFAANLIISPSTNASWLSLLGWISLIVSIFGIILFFSKYLLLKKLLGVQVKKYRKQLIQTQDSQKRNEIMQEIRTRMMDINVLSLLNSSVEDIPQTIIAIIYLSQFEFDYISIASISMSLLSILMKVQNVIMTRFGCDDVNDSYVAQDENRKIQIEMPLQHNLAMNTHISPIAY